MLAVKWGIYTVEFVYDEVGAPLGLKYRTTSMAQGVYNCYFFEKNLQGDIVAIYNSSGTKIATYTYDAWGKVTCTTASVATTLEKNIANTYNPFRYRGYFYDVETGWYYLQSRYYDPDWGRFINPDGVMAGIGGGLLGNNLFAYCMNNPINMSDEDGNWPKWIENAVNWINDKIQSFETFVNDIAEDIEDYNPYNESEDVVFSSNYFSNYKGTLVIKTSFDSSFSFGIIGLSRSRQNSNDLNHEYGHTVQMKNMDLADYIFDVAVPSVTINILDRKDNLKYDYYGAPWEAEADLLGGVNRKYDNTPWPEGAYTSYYDLIKMFWE